MADDRTISHTDQQPVRRFLHAPDGRDWSVREEPMPSFDRRGGFCLVFEAPDIVRRVRNYPRDWFALSDDALFQLCDKL